MDLLSIFQKRHIKNTPAQIRPGDVVRVHEKIKEGKKERVQIFEGVVISISRGNTLDATFAVRKISFGIGVEKTFPLHLPSVVKVEVIKKIKSRKSKLYYLRNLTEKQIQRKSELKEYVAWEEKKVEVVEETKTESKEENTPSEK